MASSRVGVALGHKSGFNDPNRVCDDGAAGACYDGGPEIDQMNVI